MIVLRTVLAPLLVGEAPALCEKHQPCQSRCLVRRSVPRQKAALSRAEPLLNHERRGLCGPGVEPIQGVLAGVTVID